MSTAGTGHEHSPLYCSLDFYHRHRVGLVLLEVLHIAIVTVIVQHYTSHVSVFRVTKRYGFQFPFRNIAREKANAQIIKLAARRALWSLVLVLVCCTERSRGQ